MKATSRAILMMILTSAVACTTDFRTTPGDGNGDAAGDGKVEEEGILDDTLDGEADHLTDAAETDVGEECGNGSVDEGEECDDGNRIDDDGCDGDCTWTCVDDSDCADRDLCNGNETCNRDNHTCKKGEAREDGFMCGEAPRMICLGGGCNQSLCGDGFVDTGGEEGCEPPGEGGCNADCHFSCTVSGECRDDGNPCNGEEYCDTAAHACSSRDAPGEGAVCEVSPRKICVGATCQLSACGDGFVDRDAGEECEDGNDDPDDGCEPGTCAYSCHGHADCDDGHACTEDRCGDATHACAHAPRGNDFSCRPANGACDVAEYCDAAREDCPSDRYDSITVCRTADSSNLCDVPETCVGDSPYCPVDSVRESGYVCRAQRGDCDVAETCDGAGKTCPLDGVRSAGFVCRAVDGLCDTEEVCDGGSKPCPADAVKGFGIMCALANPAEPECDPADTCNGMDKTCPAFYALDGAECSDGEYCTQNDQCSSHACNGTAQTYLFGIAAISGGGNHTCAKHVLNGLKCWGFNRSGQCGNGDLAGANVLRSDDVVGLSADSASSVSSGGGHTCAVTEAGGAICWGEGEAGQLGNGDTADRYSPAGVTGLASGVGQVCGGSSHSCARNVSGRVKCWGDNSDGALGDGTTINRSSPVDVKRSSSSVFDRMIDLDCRDWHT